MILKWSSTTCSTQRFLTSRPVPAVEFQVLINGAGRASFVEGDLGASLHLMSRICRIRLFIRLSNQRYLIRPPVIILYGSGSTLHSFPCPFSHGPGRVSYPFDYLARSIAQCPITAAWQRSIRLSCNFRFRSLTFIVHLIIAFQHLSFRCGILFAL